MIGLATAGRISRRCVSLLAALALAGCIGGGGGGPPPGGGFGQSNAPAVSMSPQASAVVQQVNQIRAANGLPGLAPDPALQQAAQLHAQDMAGTGNLSHTGSDGSDMSDRVLRAGYQFRTVAENVAAGQTSAQEVVASWMDSPGHRANVLRPEVRNIGAGYAQGQASGNIPGVYWVLVFAAR